MSIAPVSAVTAASVTPTAYISGASSTDTDTDGAFASQLTSAIDGVQGLQSTSSALAIQAVTGDLADVHDYTIAATEAAVALELTSAVRNRAVEAFTEIMRIQV